MQVEDGDGGALAVYTETAAGSGNRLQLVAVNLTGNSCGKGQGGAVSVDSQGLVMQDVKVYGNKVHCKVLVAVALVILQHRVLSCGCLAASFAWLPYMHCQAAAVADIGSLAAAVFHCAVLAGMQAISLQASMQAIN